MKAVKISSTIALLAAVTATPALAELAKPITEAEIRAAQETWGAGIVAIGDAKTSGGDYASIARRHVDRLYAYDEGKVLFKPTKAAADQFRGTFDEAVSYFVKGVVPEDKGFAINPWTKVRFENEDIVIDSDSALAMGNYFFTTPAGDEVKVEYSFGYIRGEDGQVLINLHHSSLPYATN